MSRTTRPEVNVELRTAEPTPTPLDYGARGYPGTKVKLGLPPSVAIVLIICGSAMLVAPWIFSTTVMHPFMPPGALENIFQALYPWGSMAAGSAMIVFGYLKSLRPIS